MIWQLPDGFEYLIILSVSVPLWWRSWGYLWSLIEPHVLPPAVLKKYQRVCALLYLGGLIWFCLLAYTPLNRQINFYEKALAETDVKGTFPEQAKAVNVYHRNYNRLLVEIIRNNGSIPHLWLLKRMRQIGLESYNHNFTLQYPLGKQQKFTGNNVYGILRAPRTSATTALVLSVPYRSTLDANATTTPSIALMLTYAQYARSLNRWGKNVIFLITEHEQLGMQAWLEAYHSVTCGNEGILDHGDLRGRAGILHTAINLELHEYELNEVEIKVEGLNGRMPNSDLFCLTFPIMPYYNLRYRFKENRHSDIHSGHWSESFQTLIATTTTLATGIPNGNHGLYHRFGIPALTLESTKSSTAGIVEFTTVGQLIDRFLRALNFHEQRMYRGFFFYFQVSPVRFIPFGRYIATIFLIAGALFFNAFGKYRRLDENPLPRNLQIHRSKKRRTDNKYPQKISKFLSIMEKRYKVALETLKPLDPNCVNFGPIMFVFLITHAIGILLMNSPQPITFLTGLYNYSTEISLFCAFMAISIILLTIPVFIPFREYQKTMSVFNILSLLELGAALIFVSMNNFSLALYCGIIYVPLALVTDVCQSKRTAAIVKVLWLMAHPLFLFVLIVLVYTFVMFPDKQVLDNFQGGLASAQQAIVQTVVDSMIYGNWVFDVVMAIFVPNWLCFWIIAFAKVKPRIN